MTSQTLPNVNLGFLTVLREPGGFVGGYLITNFWGRPLEFRLSSPVQPNKVQQILYGPTLEPFVSSDLIGKKLIEKTTSPVQFVFTDQPACLDLRLHLGVPVCLTLAEPPAQGRQPGLAVREPADTVFCHARFAQDVPAVRELLENMGGFDLADPFLRIREALAEARKLGVNHRAA